jgi:hypothetical protein
MDSPGKGKTEMLRKLMALGLFIGMAGVAACEPREEPAFDDDFQFEEAPPATPAPAPMDTLHMDPPHTDPGY